MTSMNREQNLNNWAKTILASQGVKVSSDFCVIAASDDASFRRYFRGETEMGSFIFVDAPPEREDCQTFVKISELLVDIGINAPRVYQADFTEGFMMLTDLGNQLYLDVLKSHDVELIERLYAEAFSVLRKMALINCAELPRYDEIRLQEEMNLFPGWFLTQQLSLSLSENENQMLEKVFGFLIENAIEQPQVFVHRDYHSRNLMVVTGDNPGVIDFQDAVSGPVTYDLVSLLKDCYWRFPRNQVVDWVETYRQDSSLDVGTEEFLRWFDLMGLQRHLKCVGIFSRLNLRDGKPDYLKDIPLVIEYILEVCDIYIEGAEFADWLRSHVIPHLALRMKS